MANTCRRCSNDFQVEEHDDLTVVGVTRVCPKCLGERPAETAEEGVLGADLPAGASPSSPSRGRHR